MSLFQQIENNKRSYSGKKLKVLEKFLAQGFPSKKDEEYKYTNLKEVVSKEYNFEPKSIHNISKNQLDELHLGEENFEWITFINGVLHKELCNLTIENAELLTFKNANENSKYQADIEKFYNALADSSLAFTQLNTVFSKEGFFLKVPKNTVIEKPIHVFYLSDSQEENTFYNLRNLLIVEEGAKVEVIESHYNYDDSYVFTNSVTEIYVASNAKADWHKLQNDVDNSYLVDHTYVKQERDSLATVNTFSFGGELVRNNLDFIQNGENIHSFMNGVTIIDKKQLIDHHTSVHHKFPNCESYQNYKGIYGGNSNGVFNGKVFVHKEAQKTNAYQQNNNVLLDEGASVESKPQLEIFADDVKCSHGCTVGQLNADALFYLRARGISKNEAQALLLYAFTNDALRNIDIEALRLKIEKLLASKLGVDMEF